MKIELIKTETLPGKTIYYVKVNGITEEAFQENEKGLAEELYAKMVERQKAGYPKTETLLSSDI